MADRIALQADKAELPPRYFYGESANAIKMQVWVTLIANLLMTLL